jgi:hypothetical protein
MKLTKEKLTESKARAIERFTNKNYINLSSLARELEVNDANVQRWFKKWNANQETPMVITSKKVNVDSDTKAIANSLISQIDKTIEKYKIVINKLNEIRSLIKKI